MNEFKNSYLMLIATAASFALLFFLLYVPIPKDNVQLFIFLAGSLVGFFFGSSITKPKPADPSPSPVQVTLPNLSDVITHATAEAVNKSKGE